MVAMDPSSMIYIVVSHSHFEGDKHELNPTFEMVNPPDMNEPRYAECGGDVTKNEGAAMEEDPTNQSVDAECTAKVEEPACP